MDSAETIGFRRAVERACEDWKIEKETKVLWPLYTINNVEYIGEVLRKRRLVLGFSKEDLVEGICDLRTIQRYEAGTTCPRKYTAGQLLKKMGLPDVYLKRFFLTFESNQNKLFKAIRDNYNAGKYRNVVAMTEPLVNGKEELEPYNYQRLMWYLLESKYKIKELSQEEWLEDMKENLSTTVEWKKILGSEAKYLSYNEVDYLTSILYNLDKKETDYMTLLFCVEKYAEENSCSYQLINYATVLRVTMNMIQDAYADMELWEKTNMWCEKMLEVAGFFRNMRIFQDAIYNLWWNHKEEDKTTESVKPSYLVDLAKLMKDEENERFFASRFPED